MLKTFESWSQFGHVLNHFMLPTKSPSELDIKEATGLSNETRE